ncbi:MULTISPECIES: hypothetical protein [unclassified Yoonia]|uniref:hypothetical protein n=1 Tax=unclassified Yoonia TaxID=2629118 RepID=UPI002AFEA8C7|nr:MULTISPECIES: hypothetical protein [unclassified Yoonia]
MRDFFIRSLDRLIGVFVVISMIVVVVVSLVSMAGGMAGGGFGAGLVMLVLGLLYVVFVAGFMYLGVGIYHNTRRSAEAMERMANK